jgi:hypothetical protein
MLTKSRRKKKESSLDAAARNVLAISKRKMKYTLQKLPQRCTHIRRKRDGATL